MGPPQDPAGQTPPRATRYLPSRKDSKATSPSPNLRTMYRISAQQAKDNLSEQQSHQSVSTVLPNSPLLPPTPPGASNGSIPPATDETVSDAPMFRSALVTPINQNNPPTPDNTPPRERKIPFLRPFLDPQPSVASTYAESFKTAREGITSEDESDSHSAYDENGLEWPVASINNLGNAGHALRHSAFRRSPLANTVDGSIPVTKSPEHFDHLDFRAPYMLNGDLLDSHKGAVRFPPSPEQFLASSPPTGFIDHAQFQPIIQPVHVDEGPKPYLDSQPRHTPHALKRDKSLRDRLLEAQDQDPSASTEKFASIIGWNNCVPIEDTLSQNREGSHQEVRRFSGVSTASTIEAYVFEQKPLPRRRTTLRHMSKHESLRSVSSPLPASTRNSMNSASDSPHRLVHKRARLSNQSRWSFGSEVSRSYSLASSALLPKSEVIRVAVIPERRSSLPSSNAGDSKRQSLSTGSARSQSRKVSDNPPSSWQHKRTLSESVPRGREVEQGPVIPPRSSSLSAPTSRTTSRANSIASDHLRVRRQQAEKDLRKTLDQMEADRLVQDLRDWELGDQSKSMDHPDWRMDQTPARSCSLPATITSPTGDEVGAGTNALGLVLPGTLEWAALRPPSILETPFSQPSFRSASPEISEAHAINFFPHNNHSLQLIEPFHVQESKAVLEVQRQQLPHVEVDSPLRNPRRPPEAPQFKIIPPTPADDLNHQLSVDGAPLNGHSNSMRRSDGSRRRSESLLSSISRNLSLKNARNKKADQKLDGELHPFWRPRAFWDDIDDTRPEEPQNRSLNLAIVNNSLGLPQERIVVTGPVSLVRRISERRRQRKVLVKQSSHGSLAKLKATRQFYNSPILGMRFHFIGIKGLHERIIHAKQRKDDEKREKRRAELRRSIGANVVMQGDSRFPASNTSLARNM